MSTAIFTMPFDLILEPSQEQCFIAGYESSGKEWTGTFISYRDSYAAGLAYGATQGATIALTPTGAILSTETEALYYRLEYDMLWCMPAGTNAYQSLIYNRNPPYLKHYPTGAGDTENYTGRKIATYQEDVVEGIPVNVLFTIKEGVTYTVSHISRVNSTTIQIKLAGVPDVRDIGYITYNMPLNLSGLTGSDISPLPSGDYVTSFIGDGSSITFLHNTSAGTIGGFQALSAGTLRFGSTDSTKLYIVTDAYRYMEAGWAVKLAGISGFTSNPNGIKVVHEVISDGFGDKFRITHNTVGGSNYAEGGTAIHHTSSNACAFIAGLLLAIRDELECSWHEATERLNLSATGGGVFDDFNGYGKGTYAAAIAYSTPITPEPAYTMGSIGSIGGFVESEDDLSRPILVATFTLVTNATQYQVLRDGALWQQIEYNQLTLNKFSVEDRFYFKSETRHEYKYRGRQRGTNTALSNQRKLRNKFMYKTFRPTLP